MVRLARTRYSAPPWPKCAIDDRRDDPPAAGTTAQQRWRGANAARDASGPYAQSAPRATSSHRAAAHPSLKIGTFIRFDPDELGHWIDHRRAEVLR
jgi:hypothetical protein